MYNTFEINNPNISAHSWILIASMSLSFRLEWAYWICVKCLSKKLNTGSESCDVCGQDYEFQTIRLVCPLHLTLIQIRPPKMTLFSTGNFSRWSSIRPLVEFCPIGFNQRCVKENSVQEVVIWSRYSKSSLM